jgi:hypothetical protein
MFLDVFTCWEIEESIRRTAELLASGIFLPQNRENPLVRSAFIETLICLRDLMYKAEKFTARISFDNDIAKNERIRDASDLIKYIRDALCHIDSENHYLETGNIRASYNIAYGKITLVRIGEFSQSSDYEDDVCFFFGSQKIYLKRDILRAFEEAKHKLLPLLSRRQPHQDP